MEDFSEKDIEIPFEKLSTSKTIGKGATAVVKRGKYRIGIESVDVAIKEIILDKFQTKEKIFHEVKLNILAKNENVIKIYGVAFSREEESDKEDDGGYSDDEDDDFLDDEQMATEKAHVVFQYCELGDLARYMRKNRNKLSIKEKIAIFYQIAKGMAFLHSKEIIHRDLKPQNILMTQERSVIRPKICDFGASKTTQSIGQTMIGTPVYVCEEVLFPKKHSLTNKEKTKIDVYSYGIILWEILSEQNPYKQLLSECTQMFAVIHKIHHEQIRPNLDVLRKKNISNTLIELAKLCWSKNPRKRPEFKDIVKILQSERKKISQIEKISKTQNLGIEKREEKKVSEKEKVKEESTREKSENITVDSNILVPNMTYINPTIKDLDNKMVITSLNNEMPVFRNEEVQNTNTTSSTSNETNVMPVFRNNEVQNIENKKSEKKEGSLKDAIISVLDVNEEEMIISDIVSELDNKKDRGIMRMVYLTLMNPMNSNIFYRSFIEDTKFGLKKWLEKPAMRLSKTVEFRKKKKQFFQYSFSKSLSNCTFIFFKKRKKCDNKKRNRIRFFEKNNISQRDYISRV